MMFYSSGMPALYFIGAINFFILYWVYKILLIKFYQITTSFNQDMALKSMRFYKFAVILHLIMGSFMYTNSDILTTRNIHLIEGLKKFLLAFLPKDEELEMNYMLNRFTNPVGMLYLLFFLFVIALYIFQQISKRLLRIAIYILCCCGSFDSEKQ